MANSYYSGVNYLLTIDTNGYVSIVNGGLTNLTYVQRHLFRFGKQSLLFGRKSHLPLQSRQRNVAT